MVKMNMKKYCKYVAYGVTKEECWDRATQCDRDKILKMEIEIENKRSAFLKKYGRREA